MSWECNGTESYPLGSKIATIETFNFSSVTYAKIGDFYVFYVRFLSQFSQFALKIGRAVWGLDRLVLEIVGSNPAYSKDVCISIFLCCPV
jgi:hypothetical protein